MNSLFQSANLITNLIIGAILSLFLIIISYKFKLLTRTGIIAVFILALIIYTFGALKWTLPIVTFFVISSLISKVSKKNIDVYNQFEKSDQRDHIQVLANGGLGGVIVLLNYFHPSYVLYVIYVSVVASVCADTWSTEIGTYFKTKTVDILSFKEIKPGISGGISLPGIMASAAGAVVIAVSSLPWLGPDFIFEIIIISSAGFSGSIADSIMGSSLQKKYKCISCGTITEKKNHCGKDTIFVKGNSWINNDAVNFGAGLSGGIFSLLLFNVIKG